MTYEPFSSSDIDCISQCLGEAVKGIDITNFFHDKNYQDNSFESTKWKRLRVYLSDTQRTTGYCVQVLQTIKEIISKTRFIGDEENFEKRREDINKILIFHGITYCEDGEFRECQPAKTISEAERRASVIRKKFNGRNIHPEVLRFCRAELMQDNYFHAVFEATKGVAQRLRDMSGKQSDGAKLVDETLLPKQNPLLAINSLQTDSERSEQNGFASLIKGCFEAVRNPLAHEPKIMWNGEDDVADLFSLLSLIQRKLDGCVRTDICMTNTKNS